MVQPMCNACRVFSALTLSMLLTACSGSDPAGTAIVNVTVIDAVHGVRPAQTVVFDGDRILEVTDTRSGYAPDARHIIDGTGRYLVPGLWDFHVHLTYEQALIDRMSNLFLSYGVTSVRDTGGLIAEVTPVVEAMRAPGALAPRVYFAGPLLDGNDVVYDGNARPEIGTRNPDRIAAQNRIDELQAQGVDFIKIYELVSPQVFYAMVERARFHGLPIDSHVPLSLRRSGGRANGRFHGASA